MKNRVTGTILNIVANIRSASGKKFLTFFASRVKTVDGKHGTCYTIRDGGGWDGGEKPGPPRFENLILANLRERHNQPMARPKADKPAPTVEEIFEQNAKQAAKFGRLLTSALSEYLNDRLDVVEMRKDVVYGYDKITKALEGMFGSK